MVWMKRLLPIAIVLLIVAIGVFLANAPLYARLTAEECVAAYAKARTRTDTAHVDGRRLRGDFTGGAAMNHRCGEVRAARLSAGSGFPLP
jgi:hypothetical protein